VDQVLRPYSTYEAEGAALLRTLAAGQEDLRGDVYIVHHQLLGGSKGKRVIGEDAVADAGGGGGARLPSCLGACATAVFSTGHVLLLTDAGTTTWKVEAAAVQGHRVIRGKGLEVTFNSKYQMPGKRPKLKAVLLPAAKVEAAEILLKSLFSVGLPRAFCHF
jgi:hypothetical protein